MAKKERLGSDPFKESSLNWIQDTREEKKEPKEIKKQKDVKTSKRQNVLTPEKDKVKKPGLKKRHTIYLSSKQSKKLKVYAAGNDMKLSEVIEKLINEKI